MKKIFLLLTSLLFLVSPLFVVQATEATDITKPDFRINLQNMNPVQASQANSSTPTGRSAALFLLDKFAGLLLVILPIIAGISFIIAGYYYVLSGGDSEKASQAKTIIKWNIIAIIIALFSYALVKMVSTVLG